MKKKYYVKFSNRTERYKVTIYYMIVVSWQIKKRKRRAVFVSKFRVYFLNSVRSSDHHHKLSLIRIANKQISQLRVAKIQKLSFFYTKQYIDHPSIHSHFATFYFLETQKIQCAEIIVIARENKSNQNLPPHIVSVCHFSSEISAALRGVRLILNLIIHMIRLLIYVIFFCIYERKHSVHSHSNTKTHVVDLI